VQPYKKIDIFTSEGARWQGQPLYSAIVEAVHDLKIAARCLVTRGIEGAYESGEVSTGRLEVLSYNLPVQVAIVLPAAEADRVLARVEEMVKDGIVAVQEVQVLAHRTRGLLLPAHIRVRDIMTPDPRKVTLATSLSEVARLLLSSDFTGLPVVDQDNRPVGVISQGDLIYKAGLPMRLGLLAVSDQQRLGPVLEALGPRPAREVMTSPAVTVKEDGPVTEAVTMMLDKGVKRLPVVDAAGRLVGMLSRVDVFRASLRESPDWHAFREQQITVGHLHSVADIMQRQTATVTPETPVEDVIAIIDKNAIQRVCVVDEAGRLLGLIADRDLLVAFSAQQPGIWDYLASKIPFTERGQRHKQLQEFLRAKTAGGIMNRDIVTVREDAPINEALRLMLDRALKRLPVVDADGRYKGMLSREALLRAGFAADGASPDLGPGSRGV
jgi:CBS domain-containing protein